MNLLSPATPVLSYGRLVNQASPLNRGLVAWWLNLPQGGKGNTFFDICGKNHGTLTSGPTWTGARGGQGRWGAIDFAPVDDRVDLGSPDSLQLTGEMTISVWIRPDTVGAGERQIVNNGEFSASNYYLSQSAATLFFVWANSAMQTGSILTASEWHHITAVRSGSAGSWTRKVYLNGVETTSGTTATNPSGGTRAMTISARPSSLDRSFDGLIDGLRIYDRALPAPDVMALFRDERRFCETTLNRIRLPVLGEAGGGGGGANRRRRVIICGAAA